MLPPLFHTFHHVPLSDGCRICYLWQQNENKVLSLPHSSTFFCLVCHPAIIFVLFVVLRSFVLSFSLHIRPCSLLPLLPLFFACCCCFFCASPSSFCFPCFSLLFVRALSLFSVAILFFVRANTSCSIHVVVHTQSFSVVCSICKYVVLPPLFHTFHHVPLSDGCRICSLWQQNDNIQTFVSASFLHVLLLSLCHPAIIFVLFVVRRSFVLSFSLHIRLCSLLPLLPLFFACCCCFFLCLALFVLLSVLLAVICARRWPFFCCFLACCCCFFCASPFLFCFPFFSLLFVRALCLFFYCFLLYCSAITESLLCVRQLHERQRHNRDLHRQN